MNALGASILGILVVVVLLASRRGALLGMMAGVLYLTQAQGVQLLGFNMFAIRFLELAAFARVVARGEFSFSRLNKIDRTLLLLYGYTAFIYSLRTTEGLAFVIGLSVDAFLCYFVFRSLITDVAEFRWFLRMFVVLLTPFAALVLIESLTKHSPFSLMGGAMQSFDRGDRYRCLGSFRNPDLLGTLGASFLPLYIALARVRLDRIVGVAGIGLCLMIVWASNSGGPLAAVAIGLIGWAFWLVRTEMRKVRRGMVVGIVLLALMMKAPVWYLLARVSEVTGGDGWHRSYLMDVSFRHLREWWLAGIPMIKTSEWFPYSFTTGADITNQYLSFGLTAGLGALVLFILLVTRGFSSVGQALARIRLDEAKPGETEYLFWGLGVMLAVHVINWFGITYFDQTYVIWFMQLAAVSGLSARVLETTLIESREMDGSPAEAGVLEAELQFDQQLP